MRHLGEQVRLNVPDNPRLHGAQAVVTLVTPWGAYVETAASATGRFRALEEEMLSGDDCSDSLVCDTCGGMRWLRTGTCLTCLSCGTSSGGCG